MGSPPQLVAGCAAGLAIGLAFVAAARAQDEPAIAAPPSAYGAPGVIHGVVDVAVPADRVWKALIDCSYAPELMGGLKSRQVMHEHATAPSDGREQVGRGGAQPAIHTVIHADYDRPSRVYFHSISGNLKLLEGEWRFEPLDGGARTRVYYDSRATAPFTAPGPILRSASRRDMPKTLANLRDACEALSHP
jgi:carbon monoxide dehydrogenase subunit G